MSEGTELTTQHCDQDHENCPRRFDCAIGWPFPDIDAEDDAKEAGTFEQMTKEIDL